MDNNRAPIAADGAGAELLNGKSHRDYIDGLVYRDRQAIKDFKRRIKAAVTSEERAELERQKRLLEQDFITLQ